MMIEAGRTAVVTGAGSGIGRALAQRLAERGVNVVVADVEPDALAETAASISDFGRKVVAEVVDVRRREDLERLYSRTAETFGPTSLLVNNAGVNAPRKYIWEYSEADWRWVTEVNWFGVLNGIHAFVPNMVERNSGHVVNVSSIAGLGTPGRGAGVYGGTKHAVVALTEGLRGELAVAAPQVRVTLVCPGLVTTNIRDAERNRPAEHAASGLRASSLVPAARASADFISAEDAAEGILAGVDADRELVLVGTGTLERAYARLAHLSSLLDELGHSSE